MRAVVTRVASASVQVDGVTVGAIERGFLILLGVGPRDGEAQCKALADKILGLRVFEDEKGKMNLGLEQVGGQVLVVSQFTLYGNCRKGRRPSFMEAARPCTRASWSCAGRRDSRPSMEFLARIWRWPPSMTGPSHCCWTQTS